MEHLVHMLTGGEFNNHIHLHLQMKGSKTKLITVWDVHHLWAGKPLFSGHMQTTPMCSLCIPAFPEFRNMRPSAGDPEVDRGNSGNHRTTFGHHSYPPRTSHVIS